MTMAMENDFDLKGKNGRNLQENVSETVKVVAAAPSLGPSSTPSQNPHALSS